MQTQQPSALASRLAVHPYLDGLLQHAARSFDAGEHEDAEVICQQLITLAPDKPMGYSLMSRLCLLKGQVRPATLNAFLASQRAAGSHWKDILSISSSLIEVGEYHLAYDVLSCIDPRDPANRDGLLELGRQYGALQDRQRALDCIELARSLGCTGWLASHFLGAALGSAGRVEQAIAACEDSIAQHPSYGRGHWSRAQFASKQGAGQRVARIREAIATPGLGNGDTTHMHYALFKELDALERTDEAWQALMAGASARRIDTEFNVEKENRAFDALIRVASARFLDRCGAPPTEVTPIFIVGMPCAGANLLEGILGAHPQIAICGQLDDFLKQMQWVNNVRLPAQVDGNFGNFVAHLNYNVLGRRYLEKTRWLADGKAFSSDANPMNFMLCGMILRALPHARIIHMRRHPMDSCFHTLEELFANGAHPYSYTLAELANHYRNYDRLMQHWHGIAPGRILDVRYEDLVAQPELQAKRVQKYLGLPAVGNAAGLPATSDISAACAATIRQPNPGRSIGGWRRYEKGLAPLQSLLSAHIDAYQAPGRAILLSRL